MSKASRYLAAVLFLFCTSVQAQVAVGEAVVISPTGTTPSVAADGRGGFVLVWADHGEDDWGIFGQVFPVGAGAGGSRFQVNASDAGPQTEPRVAAGGDGRFTVAWQGGLPFAPRDQPGGDGDGTGVFARRFRAGGAPEGGQAAASRFTAEDQYVPVVAMGRQGDFVTAWQEESGETIGEKSAIVALRFSSAGLPVGPELRMETVGSPNLPSVAMSSQGFAVGWNEAVFCAPNHPQFVPVVARFDKDGRQVGEAYRLAAGVCGVSGGSSLRALAGSRAGFLAVFAHIGNVSTYSAQRFSPTGEPVGGRFTVPGRFSGDASQWNDLITGLAMDDRGRFVILWETFRSTPAQSERILSAQVFSVRNRPLRKAFTVSADSAGSAVSLANGGSLMVAWKQSGVGLKVHRFRL